MGVGRLSRWELVAEDVERVPVLLPPHVGRLRVREGLPGLPCMTRTALPLLAGS